MRSAFTLLVALPMLVAGGALVVIYSGIYNVAATREEPAFVGWLLHVAMTRSVELHARGIEPPAGVSLHDPQVLQTGFEHYNEMCIVCHGAPGVEPGEAHAGLNPKPPNLVEHAGEMSPGELFWVIKHGIRMTGMPAWGPTHSDGKIWAMVAFVKQLPEITSKEYRQMRQRSAHARATADHPHGPSGQRVPDGEAGSDHPR